MVGITTRAPGSLSNRHRLSSTAFPRLRSGGAASSPPTPWPNLHVPRQTPSFIVQIRTRQSARAHTTVPDVDRKALHELVVAWQPRMMSGEMGPAEVNQVLGKIAVALGPDAYNRFVDGYNNGTAGGK